MQEYLTRALKNDVSDSDLMNVIRIILNKPITKQGAEGEKHYASVAKREKDAVNKYFPVEVEEEVSEEQEVEEIVSTYNEVEATLKPQRYQDEADRKVDNALKRDKNFFKLMVEDEDCDDSFIYDAEE